MTRKAREPGFVAGMVLLLAVHLPSATLAQDGTDRVTGFPRDPVHVAAWPAAKRSQSASHYSSRSSASARARSSARTWRPATRTS